VELFFTYADQVLTLVILAVSLNLLQGYTGQVSVAQAAFAGVGGYTLAYVALNNHFNTIEALLLAIVVGALVGLVLGLPALRLTTEWLILLTLAAQTIIVTLVTTNSHLGGTHGLQNITGLEIFGKPLLNPSDLFVPFLVFAVLVFAICFRLGESPYGRVLRAIREDEIAARALGKNIFAYKLTVFCITSAMAGLGGALMVVNLQIASPTQFGFDFSSAIVAVVVIGGSGNVWGTLVGVLAVAMLGPVIEHVFNFSADAAAVVRQIAYGVALVAIVLVRPAGILPDATMGRVKGVLRRLGKDNAVRAALELATKSAAANDGALPAETPSSNGVSRTVAAGNDGVAMLPHVHLDAHVHVPAVAKLATAIDDGADIVLRVTDLTKRFGGITAVEGLNFTLRRGKITALVGPNGAGKTTVFNLLTGAIAPDTGIIKLHGSEIMGLTPDAVARRGMARSFQDVRVFPRLSALENVMLANQHNAGERIGPLFSQFAKVATVEREAAEKAFEWLRFVGMDEFAAFPAGALAFGQQKLVAMARVLATEADVLLLDEPASGIDQQWIDVMLSLIEQVREQGRSVCIVEHNLHVVDRLADHTYFMELGRITAEGNFADLTSDKRLAEAYFGTA